MVESQDVGESIIDLDKLRANRERRIDDLSKDPTKALMEKVVEVKLIKNYHKEAKARGFTIVSDEPEILHGTNLAPQPTEYMLASLAFCQMSIYANVASSMRIPIDSLEISVKGKRDNRGLLGIADVRPGYKEIIIETNIKANGQEDRILRMAELVEKHCPVYDNLANPVPIKNNVNLNGNRLGTI